MFSLITLDISKVKISLGILLQVITFTFTFFALFLPTQLLVLLLKKHAVTI